MLLLNFVAIKSNNIVIQIELAFCFRKRKTTIIKQLINLRILYIKIKLKS
jgi:hypothetical protein